MIRETRNWNPWEEMLRMQRDIDKLFRAGERGGFISGEFPAVNIWNNEHEGVVTAELPGIDPSKLELTVKNNTLTIRGKRQSEPLKEGGSWVRRERGEGDFVRSFQLPFQVDSDKVKADYQKGILQVILPRAEADKPRKISVKTE